jgi:hypothetical protein
LHDKNPNYLEYKGKPLLIVSSSEQYGSVYNTDFDFRMHLHTLKKEGMNYTRIFTGLWETPADDAYVDLLTPFTCAPGKQVTPFARINGQYDLDQWDTVFFNRLHQMLIEAQRLDIIVEITLFCVFYKLSSWLTSPFYFKNCINKLDSLDYKRVHTMYNGNLWKYQEKMVRKIVSEVNNYPNCYFEIQNEPWSDAPNLQSYVNLDNDSVYPQKWQKMVEVANDASLEWQQKISDVIVDEESKLPNKHLVSQNIGNFSPVITNPDPNISIFNFHYALPIAAFGNLNLKKVMTINETGFMPHNDFNYRREAWQFMLNGGGVYNNLDYSFIVGKEDGSHVIPANAPGWGGKNLRRQLCFMHEILSNLPFYEMKPMPEILNSKGMLTSLHVFGSHNKTYILYAVGKTGENPVLKLPDGKYRVTAYDPELCEKISTTQLAIEGFFSLELPTQINELVFVIEKVNKKQ